MVDQKVSGLTTIPVVDRTADLLYIVDVSAGTSNKVTTNTLLGISGAPIGNTDSQTLTNKTIDNTNAVTLKDTNFTLQDDGDTSKQAQFQLSGITTGNTRTYTVPDANTTLVGTGTTQTLTNKTLTSPTINTPTIVNPTITADSIAGFSNSTTGTIFGVSIASGVIASVALAGAVNTAAIVTGAVTATKIGTDASFAWTAYTPTLVNMTVGNGTLVAKYQQIGKTVNVRGSFILGSTSAVTSDTTVSHPVASVTYAGLASVQPLGLAHFYNNGSAIYTGLVSWATTTTAFIRSNNAGASANQLIALASGVPFNWASTHQLAWQYSYEAA